MTLTVAPKVGDYVRHKKKGGIYHIKNTNVVMKVGRGLWLQGIAYTPAVEQDKLCVRDKFYFMQNFEEATWSDFVEQSMANKAHTIQEKI